MNTTRPVLLGYQSVRAGSSRVTVSNDRRVIEGFAEREGFALRVIYTDLAGETRSLARLLDSVRSGAGAAVVVASEADLGSLPRVRNLVRGMIENAGARLLVAQDLRRVPSPRAAVRA